MLFKDRHSRSADMSDHRKWQWEKLFWRIQRENRAFSKFNFCFFILCVSNKSLFKNRKYETQQNLEQLYFLPFFYLLTIMMQLRRDVWCLSRMNDSKTCENRFSVRTELIFTFTVAIYSKSRVRMIRYQVK